MKKIISIAFAAILAGLAISCQKEEFVSDKTDAVQYTFNIIVNDRAGFDSDASTKGSESHKYCWENGDKIFLFFKPTDDNLLKNTYATLTYDGSEWGVNAPGLSGLGEDGTLSAVYVYNLDGNVYPEFSSDDNQWTIATGNTFYNCETEVTYTVSDNVISASLNLVAPTDFVRFYVEGATGALTCNNVKGWKDIAIGSDMAVSNVTCTGYMEGFANSGDENVMEYYGRIVDGTSLNGVACEFSVVKNGKVYERPATPPSDARSFKMDISDGNWQEAKGKLPGLFTVGNGADGKAGTADDIQVRFSQGNLTCDISGATPDWKFYEHQYDCATAYDANLISLFTWGYDAANSIDPDGIDYVEGHITESEKNLSKSDDWGNVFGGESSIWRTLTTAEWQYLFETRTDASNKVGFATVNDVHGIIILPDTFTDPMKNNGSVAFVPKSTTGWTANVYTIGGNWEAMETAGAVFLPAAGRRDGFNVDLVGYEGMYWSSTARGVSHAYYVGFYSNIVYLDQYAYRYIGFSVRLITESK